MKVGIDLGTTHSVVGVWQEEGVKLIPDMEGNILIPSIVGLSEDNYVIVGQAARDRLATHPSETISEFKRFMGTDKTFQLGGQSYTAIELSAILLRSIKQQAEVFLAEPITEAVISVPAYFNNKQRKATQQAASLAGLHVERLLNEPTAAALAYGLDNKDTEQTYLVLDLGGGTFDVSVIEVFNDTFEIHASSGDNHLGGNDFTNVIEEDLYAKTGLYKAFLSDSAERNVWSLCDRLKCQLTSQTSASLDFEEKGESYHYSLTQEEYRSLCSDLIERTKFPINRVMSDADLKINEIDGLIFVGGATRMPIFQQQISRVFSRIPQTQYNPDHAIGIGAAIQAGMSARNRQLKDVIMTDVCPYTLGVEVGNGHGNTEFLPIIERNATIPVSETRSVYSSHPNQVKVQVKVFQGEHYLPKENVFLGVLEIDLEPLNSIQELYLTYTYDLNGVLEVEVTKAASGEKYRTYLGENEENLSQAELRERFTRLNGLKILPKDKLANTAFKAKLERLFQENLGDKRREVGEALGQFMQVLESHDNAKIDRMIEVIKQRLSYGY